MVAFGSPLAIRREPKHVPSRGHTISAHELNPVDRVARVFIADADPIFRDGLRALLKQTNRFEVIGDSSDAGNAVRLVQEFRPDVLLLDWQLSRQEGMRILRELGTSASPMRTLLLNVPFNSKDIVQSLECGAWGIVLKNSTTEMLLSGIRSVVAGQYWIGHESVDSLAQTIRNLSPHEEGQAQRPMFGLTSREREIIEKVVAGYSNGEIASHFMLSEHTVKHHISNVFDKVGVSTRLELAFFAVNHRLADL